MGRCSPLCRLLAAAALLSDGAAAAPSSALNLTGTAVKYFGFWGPDAPAAMSSFTNLQFANSPQQAVQLRQGGIAHPLLKTHGCAINTMTRWQWRLWPDFEARVRALQPQVEPLLLNGSLLGFFLGDELLW